MIASFTQLCLTHKRQLWRALWVVVLLLHAPATLNAFLAVGRFEHGGTSKSSILLLLLCNAFFVFEICFVWSLRLLANRRSAIIFVLTIVLLHTGVIERSAPEAIRKITVPGVSLLVVLGTATTAECLRLARALNVAGLSSASIASQRGQRAYNRWTRDHLDPRPQRFALSLDLPRPPPALTAVL